MSANEEFFMFGYYYEVCVVVIECLSFKIKIIDLSMGVVKDLFYNCYFDGFAYFVGLVTTGEFFVIMEGGLRYFNIVVLVVLMIVDL